ncbi:hypothetical protein T11_11918 [Trichinella zimbabwensis]|uniref:Uncharacterized protein n=1 Tax=Trichinella zimbabwensis TaxID=268475 RepID=A0A0V1HHU8_9BILA|nr:hypothetical protein T11_11918 [Trichinella zimbabwensis]
MTTALFTHSVVDVKKVRGAQSLSEVQTDVRGDPSGQYTREKKKDDLLKFAIALHVHLDRSVKIPTLTTDVFKRYILNAGSVSEFKMEKKACKFHCRKEEHVPTYFYVHKCHVSRNTNTSNNNVHQQQQQQFHNSQCWATCFQLSAASSLGDVITDSSFLPND